MALSRVVPTKTKVRIRNGLKKFDHLLGGSVGPRLYFTLKGNFAGEQEAVLAGTRFHYQGESNHRHQMYLRRSIHRLEKGLVSRPPRASFAADYIQSTVETWHALSKDKQHDRGEIRWAADVLEKYFRATSETTNADIIQARTHWESRRPLTSSTDELLAPFSHSALESLGDIRESYFALAKHRRSVRWFTDKDVPQTLVDEAITVGLTAPSACNRQSFRIVLIDDKQKRRSVASVPMGTAGFGHQIPLIAVIVGQHRGYEHVRDRHAIYVDGGLFAAQFVLALEAQGLQSVCINWPDLPEKDRELAIHIHLDLDERPIMMIGIGYGEPNQLVPRSHKRSLMSVREWV